MTESERIDAPTVPMKIVAFWQQFQRCSCGESLGRLHNIYQSDGVCRSGLGYHLGNTLSKNPKKGMTMSLIRDRYVMIMMETSTWKN